MVVHNPVAGSIAVGDILVEDSLAVGRNPAGDNLVEGIPVVGHTPAEDKFDTLHLAAGNPVAVHTPVADNSARDSPVVVDSPAVAAHTPAVLCSVADIAAFRLAADNFVAVADSSFGFVRAAAVLLPVVRNTCKRAPRPATAGNNSYNT